MPIIAAVGLCLILLAATYQPKPLAQRMSPRPMWSRVKRLFQGPLGRGS